MQVLVLAVQNAVDYTVLGAATSGVTLARGIGGSIGAAVFGTIFTSRLRAELHERSAVRSARQVAGGGRLTGAQVASLPAAARLAYENAYVHALRPVFLVAAGVGAVGFAAQPALARAAAARHRLDEPGARRCARGAEEPELAGRARPRARRAGQPRAAGERSTSGSPPAPASTSAPGAVWALARFGSYGIVGTREMAREQSIEDERVAAVELELRDRGLVAEQHGVAALTAAGVSMADQLLSARRDELSVMLDDHETQRIPEVRRLLEQLCVELTGELTRAAEPAAS